MQEHFGDMWDLEADVYVITTNGTVKKDGTAVMGRGCALEAKERFPGIDLHLGNSIKRYGNVPILIGTDITGSSVGIVTLPVKHEWYEQADLELIKRGIEEFSRAARDLPLTAERIAMPRPGCGSGQLNWRDVRPVIEPLLDDRFIVCHKEE
jgi:hypothetical protein